MVSEIRQLTEDEIKEAGRSIDKDFPRAKTGKCPFCKKLFAMERRGGINRLGYRTPVYYVEDGEHECVFLEIPKKEKEDWIVEQPRRRKKSRAEKIVQIGMFR